MCLLCIEIEKNRIEPLEAWRAFKEMEVDKNHEKELLKKIHKYIDDKGKG